MVQTNLLMQSFEISEKCEQKEHPPHNQILLQHKRYARKLSKYGNIS